MDFDTSHVRNVGEFFSQHYLDAVLGGDLEQVLARWQHDEQAGGRKTPHRALAALAGAYFRMLAGLADREAIHEHHARVLAALGYEHSPTVRSLPDGSEVPLCLELLSSGRPFLWVGEAGFGPVFGLDETDSPLDLPPLGHGCTPATWATLLDGPLLAREHPPRWLLILAGPDVFLIDTDRWPQGRYLHFELGAMLGHRNPASLRAFAALLHRDVLAPESVVAGGRSLLDEIDERSHKHAFAVSTDLRFGVQRAIELLGNEVLWDRRRRGVPDEPELAARLSRECIAYMYRLLFVFYVEARGAEVEAVPVESDAYRKGLSLERLRDLELLPLQSDQARNGTYIQQSLDQLFRVIHLGWPHTEQRDVQGRLDQAVLLRVPPQRNALFDPARTPLISGARLRNVVLQQIIRLLSLSKEGSKGGRRRGRISYAQLGINQLGAVYEGLLAHTGFISDEAPHEGRFSFRLAGRDRTKSASYYTPEVLTRCLTKYTLLERMGSLAQLTGVPAPEPRVRLRADDLLELTICEPAMGSGAFLSEAVSQLAHAYLERKQAELGLSIPAAQYQREHTKVKYHFVAHQVYGVDIYPLATELAKVSLWLGVLDGELPAPFMDTRLVAGNSLIGARREVHAPAQLGAKARAARRLEPGEARPLDAIYHFLVPHAGMAPYAKDKVVAQLCKDEMAVLEQWHKAMALPFTQMEVERLQALSGVVDQLWDQHAQQRRELARQLRQPVRLWGQSASGPYKTVAECEAITAAMLPADGPGARLRAAMDLWCRLWMWPIELIGQLPSRTQWLEMVENLLRGQLTPTSTGGFLHWELEFAEVFVDRGGFDVVLGNPPWVKVQWEEAGILTDLDPLLDIRQFSAKQIADLRPAVLERDGARAAYLSEFCEAAGTAAFTSSAATYPLLKGVQTNLHKCFLVTAGRLVGKFGAAGLIYQKGCFDDPNGGLLREHLLSRMRLHAHVSNKLLLFQEIEDQKHYEFSVFSQPGGSPAFVAMFNLLHPHTLDASFEHDGGGTVPGIKDRDGNWDLRPHRKRLVNVDHDALTLFAKLYDEAGTPPQQARLPIVHSQDILSVLRRFAEAPRKLADLAGSYFGAVCFDETGRQRDGTIRRENRFPASAREWIVSGPHFYVGTPFNKTPNEGCRHNQDYTPLDLTQIADDYLPRTNYVSACTSSEYVARTPAWQGHPTTSSYRYVNRTMIAPTGERTLIPALLPPGPAHVDLCFTLTTSPEVLSVMIAGFWASLPIDFFVKTIGKGHARADVLAQLPLPRPEVAPIVIQRALQLNCLTTHYADLYDRNLPCPLTASANPDPRCSGWDTLPQAWTREAALRTPYARRQALVELDALAALSLGLTFEQLILLYQVQFPVLQQYERETYYDQRGKIVFTSNRGLVGVGLDRKSFESIQHARAGEALPDYAVDQQGPFEPPFATCDRELDMGLAYEFFADRLSCGSRCTPRCGLA